ncbi:MAG: DUF1028 domain-containing protein [Chitinophagales bacterium]|nr:DUF1028 domain-containing protein [Chitinophagales bacterium]MDW8427029.1 DUF1028 domain-containing protein [Chitinophagales bacterium]
MNLLLIFLLFSPMVLAQRPVHTYSIVARDPTTGELGVAVQSHWFAVGPLVCWAEAGVGAIATQSFVNPAFGQEGLALLAEGYSAPEALELLVQGDAGREVRQVALVDAQGQAAAWTGSKCIESAGHYCEPNFCVQANLMINDSVWPQMAKAFQHSSGPLAERLLAALEAAQQAGGDLRGQQSAALLVVAAKPSGAVWKDRLVDLRVDDHPEPLVELRRLLKLHRAYEHMNRGDAALERGAMDEALSAYSRAQQLAPDKIEMRFWTAVTLINLNSVDAAIPMLRETFASSSVWATLLERLHQKGHLRCSGETLQRLLQLHKP